MSRFGWIKEWVYGRSFPLLPSSLASRPKNGACRSQMALQLVLEMRNLRYQSYGLSLPEERWCGRFTVTG